MVAQNKSHSSLFITKPALPSCLETKAYSHCRLREVFILTHYNLLTVCPVRARGINVAISGPRDCVEMPTLVHSRCWMYSNVLSFHVSLTESHHLRRSHMTLSQQCGRRIGHPHSLQCSHSHGATQPASLVSSMVVFWITLPHSPSIPHTISCCLHKVPPLRPHPLPLWFVFFDCELWQLELKSTQDSLCVAGETASV